MVNFNELLSLLEGYLNHVRSNNNEKLNISMAKSFIPWEFSFVFQRQKKKKMLFQVLETQQQSSPHWV